MIFEVNILTRNSDVKTNVFWNFIAFVDSKAKDKKTSKLYFQENFFSHYNTFWKHANGKKNYPQSLKFKQIGIEVFKLSKFKSSIVFFKNWKAWKQNLKRMKGKQSLEYDYSCNKNLFFRFSDFEIRSLLKTRDWIQKRP